MTWDIDFISEQDFKKHVLDTIRCYKDKLSPLDLKGLNKNILDPIKLIFDKEIYKKSWEELIAGEIVRQRDKSSNNEIGFFHQYIFNYIAGCASPKVGEKGGWDVIVTNPNGIEIDPKSNIRVNKIYVEMKNKHNTMNSASAYRTFSKMQFMVGQEKDCACFLVEAIASKSQNSQWKLNATGIHMFSERIRRVSIDNFYALVTGKQEAFYKICMALPDQINEVIKENAPNNSTPFGKDTAYEELLKKAENLGILDKEKAFIMSLYLLGFGSYLEFKKLSKLT